MKYVTLDRDGIGKVMRGEADLLYVDEPVPTGATIALKAGFRRRPTCLLHVLECNPADTGYELYIRIQPHEHQPRLLAADSSKGYTDKPYLALPGEPEAVDPHTLELLTSRAGLRHAKRVHDRETEALHARRALTLEERLQAARTAAQANYVDPVTVRREMKVIRHMDRQGRPTGVILAHLELFERVAYRERRTAN